MNHQTFDVRYIGQQRENFQIVNKPEGILPSALDLECKNGSAAVRKILFVQRVIRMFRQRRMIDFFHLGMGSQVFHHFLRSPHDAPAGDSGFPYPEAAEKAAKGLMQAPSSRSRIARI